MVGVGMGRIVGAGMGGISGGRGGGMSKALRHRGTWTQRPDEQSHFQTQLLDCADADTEKAP